MKPKIKTRITNLIAKLAGSPDYEPGIQPKEPIEFYLSDAVDGILSGGVGVTPVSVVNATEKMSEQQASDTLNNIGGIAKAYDVVLATDGINPNSKLNKTWNEISVNLQNRVIFCANSSRPEEYFGIVVSAYYHNGRYIVEVFTFTNSGIQDFRTNDPESNPTIPDK